MTRVHIYIDADACPVKEEVYRVARRYGLEVTLVANAYLRIPREDWARLKLVPAGPDEADDWIAESAVTGDIVVTADIPLAARCVKKGAYVLSPKGKMFTENDIGMTLATRNLLSDLRDLGEITGGPPPFQPRDRSRFLQQLDKIIQKAGRPHG
ncbi:MAG: YaiI/YqxD family protein [Lentisphaeria bacterium]|nr:YaiI/YqxD family protein [Lentisphaeria bacterium]